MFKSHRQRAALCIAVTAGSLLVSAAHAGGSITLSPANNIQAAINSGNFSEIILAPGSYNQNITISAVHAPLTIRSQDPAHAGTVAATILDGEFLTTSVIHLNAGVGPDVVIDGITVQNGVSIGAPGPEDRGGGIDCEAASPTIRRCRIVDNVAEYGGGIYVNAGTLTLEDVTFINNVADFGGGAYGNSSTIHFVRCTFDGNNAQEEGGAARLYTGTYSFTECDFLDNTSIKFGGAFVSRNGALFSTARCWFENNFSGDGGSNGRGGAIYHDGNDSSSIDNSVFWNNNCSNFGSSIYTLQNITVRNSTYYGDVGVTVIDVPTGGRIDMYNSILWNFSNGSVGGAGTRNVQFCNIQGGYAGTGNIGSDSGDAPTFLNAATGNFRLGEGSAGVDAGDATKVLGQYPTDFDSFPRALNDPDVADSGIAVLGISVDMGAFEFQPEGIAPPNTCLADIVDSGTFQPPPDGLVDGADLAYLLGAWGSCR